jgi:nitrogen fixation NifU-like protein
MVTAPIDAVIDADALGKLAIFAGVREFPVRVKCATLAWHTLEAALGETTYPVTTE